MTALDDDFAAYVAAATPPAGDPLAKLLGDLVAQANATNAALTASEAALTAIEAGISELQTVATTANSTIKAFNQLEANILAAGVVWNPQRLNQLAGEGITPS